MARRDAILSGVSRAAELHDELKLRDRLRDGGRPMDVFAAIQAFNVVVLFRPLEGLLGAYVPTPNGAGMMVSTQRNHHVQRFTAAHELGHHVMEHHAPSLDLNIGYVARGERDGYDEQEIEADAFAAEFLLPSWLIAAHARRQRWTKGDLAKADVVYQLSLRLAASYSATCWALLGADFISRSQVETIVARPPKEAKQRAIQDVRPASWHPDVWLLTERDSGAQLLGSPEDFLVLNLNEHLAGGYEWALDDVPSSGFAFHKDHRVETSADIGGTVTRQVVVQGNGVARTKLKLEERRPWEGTGDALQSMEFDLALLGKEPVGQLRKERLMAA